MPKIGQNSPKWAFLRFLAKNGVFGLSGGFLGPWGLPAGVPEGLLLHQPLTAGPCGPSGTPETLAPWRGGTPERGQGGLPLGSSRRRRRGPAASRRCDRGPVKGSHNSDSAPDHQIHGVIAIPLTILLSHYLLPCAQPAPFHAGWVPGPLYGAGHLPQPPPPEEGCRPGPRRGLPGRFRRPLVPEVPNPAISGILAIFPENGLFPAFPGVPRGGHIFPLFRRTGPRREGLM